MLEALETALKRLGVTKVKRIKQHGCTLFAVEAGSDVYIISVFEKGLTDNYIGKVVPSSKVLSWNCVEVEYTPYGLYVLAGSVDELVDKVVSKLQLIMSAR